MKTQVTCHELLLLDAYPHEGNLGATVAIEGRQTSLGAVAMSSLNGCASQARCFSRIGSCEGSTYVLRKDEQARRWNVPKVAG